MMAARSPALPTTAASAAAPEHSRAIAGRVVSFGVHLASCGRAKHDLFFVCRIAVTDEVVHILAQETAYQGFFRIDRYRLRHRLYSGGWSGELMREVFERGRAVGVLLYDPVGDAVVMIEQFRLPAHLAGFGTRQLEIVAGIVDPGETDSAVARRETAEEAGLVILGKKRRIKAYKNHQKIRR